jgi:transcriptional regulator with XRE-family HTH domain
MLWCVKKQRRISDQLRAAIEAAGESRYEISKQTGINQSILSRFVRGETNLDGVNIDKLAAHLGLQLVPAKQQRKGR